MEHISDYSERAIRRQKIFLQLHLKLAKGQPDDTNETHLVSWIIKLQDALADIRRVHHRATNLWEALDNDPDYGLTPD